MCVVSDHSPCMLTIYMAAIHERAHALPQVTLACRAALADLGASTGAAAMTTLMDRCNVSHIATAAPAVTSSTSSPDDPTLLSNAAIFCRLVKPNATTKVCGRGSCIAWAAMRCATCATCAFSVHSPLLQ